MTVFDFPTAVSEIVFVGVDCMLTDPFEALNDCDVDLVGSSDSEHFVTDDVWLAESDTEMDTVEVSVGLGSRFEREKDREFTAVSDGDTILLGVGGGVTVGGVVGVSDHVPLVA